MAEGGKSKKIGRNANVCKAYRLSERREQNKVKRLLRHFKRQKRLTDASAVHCYNNLPERFKPRDQRGLAVVPTLHKRIPPKEKMPPVRSAKREIKNG